MTAAGVGAPTAPPPVEPPAARRRRRWPWFVAGAVALVGLMVAALAVAYPILTRCSHLEAAADLSRCDLAGQDLAGRALYYADLTGADLSSASLSGADLTGATLDGAVMVAADLDAADLTDASLAGADLTSATVTDATLTGADLTDATLEGTALDRADLAGTTGVTDAMLAAAFGVPESDLPPAFLAAQVHIDDLDAILQAAATVVGTGTGTADARPFVDSPAFHPTVVVDAGGLAQTPDWALPTLASWTPAALRLIELVAVAETGTEQVEVCTGYAYADGTPAHDITRSRSTVTVRLVAASTGQLVAEQTFVGTDPRACEATESDATMELVGDPVDDATTVLPWVAGYVHAPEAPVTD